MADSLHFDCHAHILPAIDHGSPDLLSSLRQLEFAALAGVGEIIATPHFYAADCELSDGISIEEFVGRRSEAYRLLSGEYSGVIKIHIGCEAHLTRALVEDERLDALCIDGTRNILTEPHISDSESAVIDLLSVLITERGLVPIIAHIERYGTRLLKLCREMGLVMQINAETAASMFKSRRYAEHIKNGSVTLLGSDVHTDPERSYRAFKRAVERLGDKISRFDDMARQIVLQADI